MNSLRISELIAVLRTKIDEQHLFDNELDAEKNAWLTVLEELLLVDGNKSAEGLGLYYFYLNIDDVLDQFDDESIDETFGGAFEFEVKNNGKVSFSVGDTTGNGKWSVEDDQFTLSIEGEKMVGTIGKDIISFDDMLEMGVKVIFAKDGTA